MPDRYRLRRHVASGGMASVWCAEDLVLDRRVAIKILSERFAHDQLAVARFKREARAAARVGAHAHVVTVFDVGDAEPEDGEDPGRAFIVMEYLPGGTVADALRIEAVRRHEAMRWLGEAASALDHAHDQGIVHRDIKPANFLLDLARVLHVGDFGIARLVSEETISSADELFGTAAYLSPEQALGRPATSASDRYALAVVAFELLTGERPFLARHFAGQARQHIHDEPPCASARDRSLPVAVDAVLRRGMAKAPEQRPSSARELVADLRQALTELPASGASRRTRGELRRRRAADVASARQGGGGRSAPRRRGRAVALMALVAAIAGVGLAVALSGRGGSPSTANRSRAVASAPSRPVTRARRPRATRAAAQSPAALQAAGHREMLAGDYQSAIATLRAAADAAAPRSLTYAYALYDLGRSLVLSGNPSGAIPVLRKRLQIPDQTAVVQQLLDEALQDSGRASTTTTSAAPPSTTTPTTTTAPPKPKPAPRPSGPPSSGGVGIGPPQQHAVSGQAVAALGGLG
ncbi:MAG: serine/threonine protein kinase [Solirubrobacterales bacterium]|nr:serine/threonine protein kinase [Solirubrobacterales bacterium]